MTNKRNNLITIFILLFCLFFIQCNLIKNINKDDSLSNNICKWWGIDYSLQSMPIEHLEKLEYEYTQFEFYRDSTVRILMENYSNNSIYTNTLQGKWQMNNSNKTITINSPFTNVIILKVLKITKNEFTYIITDSNGKDKTMYMKEIKYKE